jgi:RsiW-degrading membrane proteinase PrsW (M82 family)
MIWLGQFFAAILPAALFGGLVWETRRRGPIREPLVGLIVTFALGMAAAAATALVVARAAHVTGLDVRASEAGPSGALVFAFLVIAPIEEAGKFAAVWPSLIAKRVDQPFDGVAYATCSALGFAGVLGVIALKDHPQSGVWAARVILVLPAQIFCASLWGYALGRASPSRRRATLFPLAFVTSTVAHGLYSYFVYARGPGALLALTPLLLAMGFVSWLLSRDLVARSARDARRPSTRRRRLSLLSQPPSLATVRAALRVGREPVRIGWILFGAIVTFGGMWVGLVAGIAATHLLHVDLAAVDERDIRSAVPALLLGAGLLTSFPMSGWLIARAAGVHTLLEPALAAMLGLLLAAVTLGFAAPSTVVFALSVSPIAWLLACLGAWAGRSV